MRRLALPLASLLAFALPMKAELVKYKDWDKSPECVYLATDEEKKAWKAAKTDEEAEKAVGLFWARRDPDIKTPQNEFRQRFEALTTKADELFKLGNKRGALTERGKALLLIGPPKAMSQKVSSSLGVQSGAMGGSSEDSGRFMSTGGGGTTITQVFSYEQPQLPAWSDVKSLELKFQIDQTALTEHLLDPSTAKRLEKKAAEVAIVSPSLKELPVYKTREQVEAEQRAAQEAAMEAAKGAALTPAVREQLEPLFAKEPSGGLTLFPLAFRDGAVRLQLQLYVPGSAVATPETVKLAILVKGKDGKDAARREEAAGLAKVRGDYYLDRALPVAPGDYDVAAVLIDAAGAVVSSSRRTVTVAPLATEFATSPLFLASTDFPIEKSQPGDPFVFSARKFVARPDGKLEKSDGISYMVRVYNPTIDPASRKIALKRSIKIKPKSGVAIDVPMPADEPVAVPDSKEGNVVVVLDLAGAIVDANVGDYFRPGDYTLKMSITDTVGGKSLEVTAPFTVVGPPPGSAPAPAAPKPAPAAPKKKG